MSHLFHLIEGSKDLEVQVSVSYLEIYNETIRDLLVPDGRTLNLREDPSQGCVVAPVVVQFEVGSLWIGLPFFWNSGISPR